MGIRALIVDDSAVMRSMIISTLRRSAVPVVAVHQAGRADEALALLARAEVDLVLIDLDMATSDGEALVDAIRANPAWTEVACVLTSSTISGREGFSERGLMVVQKPFTPEAARAAILGSLRAVRAGVGEP